MTSKHIISKKIDKVSAYEFKSPMKTTRCPSGRKAEVSSLEVKHFEDKTQDANNKSPKLKIKRSQTLGVSSHSAKIACRSKSIGALHDWNDLDPRSDFEKCNQNVISYKISERTLKELGYGDVSAINWENKSQLQKPHLYDLLREMIENFIKPSLLVCIGSSSYKCHLMVLQCYSQFFRDCSTEFVIFLPKSKISSIGFEAVYNWMIDDNGRITRENFLELYRAASFLRVEDLLNQCWALIGDEDVFVEDMAFILFLQATAYDIKLIKNLILPRIYKFFLVAVSSKDFLNINVQDVILLLSSSLIGVNSEMEVFFTAVRWLNFDWKNRKLFAPKIMQCIRFALMPPWFLVTLEKVKLGLEVNRVINHVEIRKNINNGLSYATTKMHFSGNIDDLNNALKTFNLSKPTERNWIFDTGCLYHHHINCPSMRLLTYKGFLAYLLTLHKREKGYWQTFIPAEFMPKQCCQHSSSVNNFLITAEQCEYDHDLSFEEFEQSSIAIALEEYQIMRKTDKNGKKVPVIVEVKDKKKSPMTKDDRRTSDSFITKNVNVQCHSQMNNQRETVIKSLQQKERVNERLKICHSNESNNDDDREHSECVNCKLLIFGGSDPILKRHGTDSDVHGNTGNFVILYDQKSSNWKYLTKIPSGPRRHFSAVECDGKVYVLGGTLMKDNKIAYESNVWSFDPRLLKWNLEVKMPETRKNFAVVSVEGRIVKTESSTKIYERGIYVIGGQDMQGRILDTVWFFDVIHKIWSKKCSLIIPRYGLMAAVNNNEIIVAGGIIQSSSAYNSELNFSDEDEFNITLENNLTITSTVETYYLGEHDSSILSYNGSFEFESKKWYISKYRLREPRVYGRICLCSDRNLYLAGGIGKGKAQAFKTLASIDCYSFQKKEWLFFTNMDYARYGHDMVEYRNSLLVVGGVHGVGHDNRSLKEIFMYDFINGKRLNKIESLPWPLSGCSVIVLKEY